MGESDVIKNGSAQVIAEKETALIENYKKLDEIDQERILERIKTIVEIIPTFPCLTAAP